jgi:hypothetical protein
VTRQRAGLALILLGLLCIVWGVLHVVEAANGPGLGPRRFEERRGYDQVKADLHASFFGGMLRAGLGCALIAGGGWLRRSQVQGAL